MASVEKQMLGTETVRALRAQGVTSKICGCSANNMEDEFMEAGADCFCLKPFPCEKDELRRELLRILSARKRTALDSMNGSVDNREGDADDHELNGRTRMDGSVQDAADFDA